MFSVRRGRKGFTLIEVLLVLAILGIITVATLPNIARSIKGSRLRMGARTVMQAGKYARSMAVLTQSEVAVVFSLADSKITVSPSDTNAFTAVDRPLDGVNISMMNIDGYGSITEGRATVIYRSNGRCSPYKVEIVDKEGAKVLVEVDALSSVSADFGNYGEEI